MKFLTECQQALFTPPLSLFTFTYLFLFKNYVANYLFSKSLQITPNLYRVHCWEMAKDNI